MNEKPENPPQCLVCDTTMLGYNDWVWRCPNCCFFLSNLKEGVGRGIDGLEELRRDNFTALCDKVEETMPLRGTSCLEVGSAEGWFLDELKKRGADCRGIEPSEVSEIAKAAGHEVQVGFFPDVLDENERFDVIAFNDVFEHLPDPIKTIHDCEAHLKKDGLLLINLPDSGGVLYRLAGIAATLGFPGAFKRLWQYGYASPHLTYFNRRNLETFVTRYTGLQMVEQFELKSVKREGLRERVASSHSGVIGWLMYVSLMLALPLFSKLPSDIVVLVFRK